MYRKIFSKGRRAFPSNFFYFLRYTPLSTFDRQTLIATGAIPQKGLRVARMAAHRCKWGVPQVLFCSGMMGSIPFPTSFWLVCPHLEKQIGRLEGANAVDALQLELAGKDRETYLYHKLHGLIRLSTLSPGRRLFLRRYRRSLYRALARGGVGGISYKFGETYVKCLHLQTASFLALDRHPGAAYLNSAIESWECENGNCIAIQQRQEES